MIDIHCHIINGIDDGSKNEEMSLNMLSIAQENGIKEIVATPHYMRGRFNCEYKDVVKKVNELNILIKEHNLDITIYSGQEVYYSEKLIEYYNEGIIGTINHSKYMLIELPMLQFNIDEVINSIYELQVRGIVPIIAHPERYKQFIKKPSLINKFINEGYVFQLNAGSITGDFGKDVKKTANTYMKAGIYSVVGTDAHRDKGRNTDICDFAKEVDEDLRKEFKENSKAIINNEDIRIKRNKVKEKKWFW